jgi:hypothetical protein
MSQSLSHVVVLVITGEEGERRRHTNILVNKPRRVSNKSVEYSAVRNVEYWED